jgi:hypothetical protein
MKWAKIEVINDIKMHIASPLVIDDHSAVSTIANGKIHT